jgi:hypothetical protein
MELEEVQKPRVPAKVPARPVQVNFPAAPVPTPVSASSDDTAMELGDSAPTATTALVPTPAPLPTTVSAPAEDIAMELGEAQAAPEASKPSQQVSIFQVLDRTCQANMSLLQQPPFATSAGPSQAAQSANPGSSASGFGMKPKESRFKPKVPQQRATTSNATEAKAEVAAKPSAPAPSRPRYKVPTHPPASPPRASAQTQASKNEFVPKTPSPPRMPSGTFTFTPPPPPVKGKGLMYPEARVGPGRPPSPDSVPKKEISAADLVYPTLRQDRQGPSSNLVRQITVRRSLSQCSASTRPCLPANLPR